MPRESAKVKKSVVRNAESKPPTSIVLPESSTSRITKTRDYSRPELQSTLYLAKSIENTKNLANSKDSTQKTDALTTTRKLNFHLNNQVYKDLIALNKHDSVTCNKQKKPSARQFVHSVRDIEPKLEDFYETETYKDEPIIIAAARPKPIPIKKYCNVGLYGKLKSWDSS